MISLRNYLSLTTSYMIESSGHKAIPMKRWTVFLGKYLPSGLMVDKWWIQCIQFPKGVSLNPRKNLHEDLATDLKADNPATSGSANLEENPRRGAGTGSCIPEDLLFARILIRNLCMEKARTTGAGSEQSGAIPS